MLQPVDYYTKLPSGGYLIIPEKTLLKMKDYRQTTSGSFESGGVLIGSWRCNNNSTHLDNVLHAEVTDSTSPSNLDRQSRYHFVRKSSHHINSGLTAWHSSNKKICYMGEWHTHPEDHPVPSVIDIDQWKKKLWNQKAILMIIGINSDWIGFWSGKNLHRLTNLVPEQIQE